MIVYMNTKLGQNIYMFMAKLLYVQFSHELNKYVQSGRMKSKNMKLMRNPMICINSSDILNSPTICKQ
jgi:hypothetical protein